MTLEPTKHALLLPHTRRWLVVGMFTGAIFVGLPIFPAIWTALAERIPTVFHTVTMLALPLGLLALVIGLRLITGPQSRMFFCFTVFLCIGIWLLIRTMASAPAEQFHVAEYAVLAALVYRAPASGTGRRTRCRLALVFTFVVGFADEAIQYGLPNRVFDPRDIWLNWTAGGVGVVLSLMVHGKRRSEHRQEMAQPTM